MQQLYLTIREGKFVLTSGSHKGENFSYITGNLERICKGDKTFNGETLSYWYVTIKDTDGGELYTLSLPYTSGIFKSLILSLASDQELSKDTLLRIDLYEKNGFGKAVVWADGVKLDWITKELPPVNEVKIGGRIIKDDTDRMKLIEGYVAEISNRLGGK